MFGRDCGRVVRVGEVAGPTVVHHHLVDRASPDQSEPADRKADQDDRLGANSGRQFEARLEFVAVGQGVGRRDGAES